MAWYERANEQSDYAARVLGALGPALVGCRDALPQRQRPAVYSGDALGDLGSAQWL